MNAERCSGGMSEGHDGRDVQIVRLGTPKRDVPMCRPCREAAGRLGMIDNRRGNDNGSGSN